MIRFPIFSLAIIFLVSGCVWDAPLLTPSEFCEQQGGFVVTGPSLEGSADFCLLQDQSYCRTKDFQDGLCSRGENFYVCDAVGSRSEGYYDRDTMTLISFAQCSSETGMANPASAYCVEQGGVVTIRTDPRPGGGQYGVCILPGMECDEWAFYHGGCDSCLTHCINSFNETCVGHWDISGEYPDCSCGWVCD